MKALDVFKQIIQGLTGGLFGFNVSGNTRGILPSLINKYTGAGLTGQQQEQNEFNASEADKNRRFQAEQAQLDYDRQVEFYEKYQSIGAQIQQYKDNGLNPSLLAGGVSPASSAPSASSPTGSMAASSSPASESLSGFMNSIMSMLKVKSEIDVNESVAAKNNADTTKTETETSWISAINEANISQIQQTIKESQSNISVNDNTIAIGNERIALIGSQAELNASQVIINNLNAQKLEQLMPFVDDLAKAELALKEAQTEDASASAQLKVEQASLSMKDALIKQGLIDSNYFDSLVREQEWSEKSAKRNYKWTPVNNVVNNVSKIAVSAAAVVGAVKGLPSLPITTETILSN